MFYPVFVPGANLSMGDLHFSQGDGEITFCGAIEMGGFMDLHVDLIKGGMATYGVSENAIFMPGRTDPQYSEWLAFSGTSVTLDGEQRYLDSHLSYQRACLHAIDYLQKFGYSAIQAYMILGAAPIEGRLSGVVDIPNSCSTVYLPDRDLRLRRAAGQGRAVPGRPRPGSAARELLTGPQRDCTLAKKKTKDNRLTSPVDRSRAVPIGDYGFLSDGEVSALVAPGGSVDWMCVPRFDAPSAFGAFSAGTPGRSASRRWT